MKRFACLFLCICFITGILPGMSFAVSAEEAVKLQEATLDFTMPQSGEQLPDSFAVNEGFTVSMFTWEIYRAGTWHPVSDPEQVEASGMTTVIGLGLLEMDTVFLGEKIQSQTKGAFEHVPGRLSVLNGMSYEGYEIHMGRSGTQMPALLGAGTVYGTYVHGIFDAPGVSDAILKVICDRRGINFTDLGTFEMKEYKERQYDLLADAVRSGLDMDLVYRILERQV